MVRPDYTILDRVVATRGRSIVEGYVTQIELEEDYGFSYGFSYSPPQGVVNVTIRVEQGSNIQVNNSGWTIDRVVE